ncbi:MAG: TRAM domain-containing protein [Candidatus Acidiferrales bacterium]
MSRTVPESLRYLNSAPLQSSDSAAEERDKTPALLSGRGLEFWLVRVSILACATALCYKLAPFGLRGLAAAGVGFSLALVVLLVELRLHQVGIGGLLGAALGIAWGLFSALIVSLIISRTSQPDSTKNFEEYAALCAFAYLGLVLGSERGGQLNAASLAAAPSGQSPATESIKLLDTSVLIDGRIADVCDAHFLDGVLAVPQFVLHELQLVADSSDSLKRQRGRRGLEVLQRMQKMPQVDVRILEQESFQAGDVDHKLVELARRLGAKIVTNDFNLNKVATVQGLAVLNVNQLANALKPVVLPGEPMRVLILREGKEPNQGVAYLDDGTMVVVDGARRLINKSVDIQVTSVHQTTAGKMIFGRLDERQEQSASMPRHAAAAAAGRSESIGNSRADFTGRVENGSRHPEPPQSERGQQSVFPEPDVD